MAENVNETAVAELTTSTTPADPRSVGDNEQALSVSEVVANYQIGNSTLRKRLAAGELIGAYKVKTSTGEAWAIPITTLDAAGIVRKTMAELADDLMSEPDHHDETPSAPVIAELGDVLDRLTTLYEASTRQLQAAEGDRNKALVEAADAKARLEMLEATVEEKRAEAERERARADALAAELAQATRRRRWFRR